MGRILDPPTTDNKLMVVGLTMTAEADGMDLEQLTRDFEQIALANNWQVLHSAKNLAAAVSVEAAELLAEFQWLDDRQSDALVTEAKQRVGGEVADVFMYLMALCKRLDLDLAEVVAEKMAENRRRFLPT